MLNSFKQNILHDHHYLNESVFNVKVVGCWWFLFEFKVQTQVTDCGQTINTEGPDQSLNIAASDLGLYNIIMSLEMTLGLYKLRLVVYLSQLTLLPVFTVVQHFSVNRQNIYTSYHSCTIKDM